MQKLTAVDRDGAGNVRANPAAFDPNGAYAEAIRFLYGLQMFGANFGLERTRRLAELAGNPHQRLRFIHVAGTNGKGSVCALLESIYRAAGLRTGLFTSPHLVHFGERMQVDRQLPSESDLVRLVGRVRAILTAGAGRGWWNLAEAAGAATTGLGHPTFFEIVTIMALIHFAESDCELVIWETGLGGRLDATNIVTPVASVITNIAIEHASVLGDTVVKIAAEKSGIIKPGVPVITGAEDPDVLHVIHEVAASRNAKCIRADPPEPLVEQFFSSGYQRTNAAVALAVVRLLQPQLRVSTEATAAGLRQFHWPGRMQEFVRGNQRLLVDGAHNPAGLRALRETLAAREGWHPCAVIFGTLADKDIAGVLAELGAIANRVLLVPLPSPRSAAPEELARRLTELHPALDARVCISMAEALQQTAGEPLTLITGSLYLVGEALELLEPIAKTESFGERSLNDWNMKQV